MDVEYPSFGTIVIEGHRYDHDVVIEGRTVRARDKGPSKRLKGEYGHTPLSAAEDIPWSTGRLIVGTGYSGRLPILPDVKEEAQTRGIDLVLVPTAEACRLLAEAGPDDATAILHVTC